MFKIGATYTRDQIHSSVGGSKQAYIPTLNGSVVAICVQLNLNPGAPRELLCGIGPVIAKSAQLLASTAHKVPVFVKKDVNQWEYTGLYRPIASHTSGPRFNAMLAGSGRPPSDVSLAIEMSP